MAHTHTDATFRNPSLAIKASHLAANSICLTWMPVWLALLPVFDLFGLQRTCEGGNEIRITKAT